jgi:glutamate-5-semialdehyde dehydrogenase
MITVSLSEMLEQIGQRAAAASRILAQATTAEKNEALLAIARRIEQETQTILSANEADLEAGSKNGLSSAMLDRARLDPKRIHTIAHSVREVVDLRDPVGETLKEWSRPNGLKIIKRRVPIGVIGIIYESRPNVTSDAASLCLKAGNAVILRG